MCVRGKKSVRDHLLVGGLVVKKEEYSLRFDFVMAGGPDAFTGPH